MTESRSSRPENSRVEVLIAANRLYPGKNFYLGQRPFDQVFTHVSGVFRNKTYLEAPTMEQDLGLMVSHGLKSAVARGDLMASSEQVVGWLKKRNFLPPQKEDYRVGRNFALFQHMVQGAYTILDQNFPDWRTYVDAKRANHLYETDGSYKPESTDLRNDLPETYLSWLANRQIKGNSLHTGKLHVRLAKEFLREGDRAMHEYNMSKTRSNPSR